MKKRGLAILLVTGVVFSTVIGCGGETDKADGSSAPSAVSDSSADSESSADSGETYEVGYIVSDMSHEWYQNICKGAERRAEDKGIDLSISDAAMDASQQISFAENYINQGVDALIITPVDPAGLNAVVALAEEAGIPLIAESSKFDGMDCFVGIGDFEAGERMGEWMADYAAENDIDMNILIVGQPALEACRNRVDGFKAGLDNKGAEYTVAQEVDGNGTKEDSLAAATDALTAHPEVNVIFGINDNSSTGAMNAYIENGLDESKLTTLGFGFEGTVGRDALLGGTSYKSAVAMFPDYVGAAIIDVAQMAASGEELPETYDIPTTIITQENFAEFYTDNGDGTYTTNFDAIDALLES